MEIKLNSPARLNRRRARLKKQADAKRVRLITLYGIVLASTILTMSGAKQYQNNIQPPQAIAAVEATPLPEPTPEELDAKQIYLDNKVLERDQIKQYIYEIFQNEGAEVAYSISLAESAYYEPAVEGYLYYDYPIINHSNAEYSVGIFQINLYNKFQKIHADRIPGDTMDAKEKWLSNPYNNTLYTYWVYRESGWYPWSTFNAKDYLSLYGE